MQMITNTSGTNPKNAVTEPRRIEEIIWVESSNAVGENSWKTPTLHNNINKTYGIILHKIEGTLVKYFWSNLGPQL